MRLADLIIGLVIFAALATAMMAVDAVEAFYEFTRAHEDWELDEIVITVLAGLASILVTLAMTTIRQNRRLYRAVETVSTARKAEDRANQAKRTFLASMSHEMRTPLNVILGFSDLLLDSKDQRLSQTQRDYVVHTRNAGTQLLGAVEDLLTLARIDTLTSKVMVVPTNVLAVVQNCMEAFTAKAESARVTVQCASSDPIGALADTSFLRLILRKLIANGISYNQPGGSVTITILSDVGQPVRIVVADTGPGIPASKLPSVLTAFDRGGRESGTISGIGVGLAICHQVAEAMDGGLAISSEEGKGTTVTLTLQAADLAEQP
jgi:signal transduction histidine kinase